MSDPENGLYIQYGCGLSCPDGWLNFDGSPTLRVERLPLFGEAMRRAGKAVFPGNVLYGDIVKGLPLKKGVASGVYSSHVLEHLDRTSVSLALSNTYNLLAPSGIFRLVVPDLTWRTQQFIEAHEKGCWRAADDFMKCTYLGVFEPTSGIRGSLRTIFGNSAHRWMYDFALMKRLMESAGFTDIRRCKFGDAIDPMFALVEDYDRFYDDGHEELAIEARRPAEG